MEDYIAASLCPSDALKAIPKLYEQAFIGIFNGHGGKEAMKFLDFYHDIQYAIAHPFELALLLYQGHVFMGQ